jgi:hypothetical protein
MSRHQQTTMYNVYRMQKEKSIRIDMCTGMDR